MTLRRGKLCLWKDPHCGWHIGTHEVTTMRVGFWRGVWILLTNSAAKYDRGWLDVL